MRRHPALEAPARVTGLFAASLLSFGVAPIGRCDNSYREVGLCARHLKRIQRDGTLSPESDALKGRCRQAAAAARRAEWPGGRCGPSARDTVCLLHRRSVRCRLKTAVRGTALSGNSCGVSGAAAPRFTTLFGEVSGRFGSAGSFQLCFLEHSVTALLRPRQAEESGQGGAPRKSRL